MNTRKCVNAGTFYPSSPSKLYGAIDSFIENASSTTLQGRLIAGIVPHAGISYSGFTASHFYRAAKDKHFSRVVIIGPSHHHLFKGFAVSGADFWETPLGSLQVDNEYAASLVCEHSFIDDSVHLKEHSVEVQTPFLFRALGPSVKIVPVIMGRQDFESADRFASHILKIGIDDTLFIASTDLYHGYDYEEARSTDGKTIAEILRMDPAGFMKYFVSLESEGISPACGGGPVSVVMSILKRLQKGSLHLLHSSNSSDITGDFEGYTVGYASFAGTAGK